MNRHASRSLLAYLAGAAAFSLAFAATAQVVGAMELNTTVQVAVDAEADTYAGPSTALDERARQQSVQRDADRNCLRQTGTRIIARHKDVRHCVPQHGRVYTRDDLDRTGEVDIARALRKLDTSIGW